MGFGFESLRRLLPSNVPANPSFRMICGWSSFKRKMERSWASFVVTQHINWRAIAAASEVLMFAAANTRILKHIIQIRPRLCGAVNIRGSNLKGIAHQPILSNLQTTWSRLLYSIPRLRSMYARLSTFSKIKASSMSLFFTLWAMSWNTCPVRLRPSATTCLLAQAFRSNRETS